VGSWEGFGGWGCRGGGLGCGGWGGGEGRGGGSVSGGRGCGGTPLQNSKYATAHAYIHTIPSHKLALNSFLPFNPATTSGVKNDPNGTLENCPFYTGDSSVCEIL
jgi:hypothetical protein